MLVKVRVTLNSKKEDISEEGGVIKIRTTAKAKDGEANKAVVNILAKYYSKKISCVKIIRGAKSRDKLAEVQ